MRHNQFQDSLFIAFINWRNFKKLRIWFGCNFPAISRKLKDDKHVENYLIPCLDGGSIPPSSTKKKPTQ